MRLAGKAACLIFLFFFIFPLYGEDSSFTEDSSFDNMWFLFEELILSDETFFFEELFIYAGDLSLHEAGEFPDESFDEFLFDDETFLSDDFFYEEELFLSEDIFLDEETLSDEETLLAEGTIPDDDAFFFEAPDMLFEVPEYEMRSFNDIFPGFSRMQRMSAMSRTGLRRSFTKDESPSIISNPDLEINLLGSVMSKNPSHLIEAVVVVPYNERELDLLDIYNALGRIEKIKDHSSPMNGRDIYIFTESTRIQSARNRRAISDPLPAVLLPFSETIYLRLNEINLGNIFIRGDISISMYGITYNMTNFTDVRYFLVPLMRAERFSTIIYLEPVKEGILIYSMSGFYLPGFIADRVNLTPNINRRIEIFIKWITDGLRNQESIAADL